LACGSRSANIPWLVLPAELVGTAVLVLVGLSLVILMVDMGWNARLAAFMRDEVPGCR
jgi:hypothetical protein